MLDYSRAEGLASLKHCNLSGPFISYEKINCSEYGPGTIFTKLYFLPNLRMRPISYRVDYCRVERLASLKDSNLSGPFVIYEENKLL